MGEQSRSDPDATGSSALEPDGAIERLVALTEQDTIEADFYRTVVTDLVATTAGFGAALWVADGPGLRLAVQHQLSHSDPPSESQAVRLNEVLTGGQCRTFGGHSDSDALEILCPWRFDEREFGVLELRQHADLSEPALAGQERFVSVVADVILAYHRNRRLAAAARREEQWLQIDRFAQAVHRPLDLEATAYEVANEGRRLVDCDRLTVLLRRRSQWRAIAVSGTDCVNRRSSVITHLEMLARLVAAHRSAVWSGSNQEQPPADLEDLLDDYHEISSARLVGFLPLFSNSVESDNQESVDREAFGVLVVERFDRVEAEDMGDRCDALGRHSAGALHQSLVNAEMPLRGLSCLLDKSRGISRLRQQPWTVVLAVALVGLVLLLAMIPTTLRVEGTGTLQPRMQRHLFAPADSVVDRLFVHEGGQHVGADDPLIQLRDPSLQLEMERVVGELETARKQLVGIGAERLHTDRTSRNDQREAALRSAQEEALKTQIEGLEQQRGVLETRREQLSIRSPLNGQILTWDVEQLLQSRPVRRGQMLLTVADLHGPWTLELEIPDDRIADVAAALESSDAPLQVRFILATAPETRHLGTLEAISLATDVRSDRGPTVFAIVRPDDQQAMRTLRPGASVIAKIDCGHHSLLYVMSRGLLRAFRTHLLF